jgi:hypothetical protein
MKPLFFTTIAQPLFHRVKANGKETQKNRHPVRKNQKGQKAVRPLRFTPGLPAFS